jgi:hypothetical protein
VTFVATSTAFYLVQILVAVVFKKGQLHFVGVSIVEINYTAIFITLVVMFFVIIISIQYTLNKIFVVLKEIKAILILKGEKRE